MQQSRTNMSSFFQNADRYICSFPPEYRKIIDQITMLRYWDPSNKVVLTLVQSQIKSTFGTCAYTCDIGILCNITYNTSKYGTIISMRVKENISWPHNVVIKYNAFVIVKSRLRLLAFFFFCIPWHIFPLKTLPIFVVSTLTNSKTKSYVYFAQWNKEMWVHEKLRTNCISSGTGNRTFPCLLFC